MADSSIKAFIQTDQAFLPQLSIDCVIFGYHDNQLKVLLLEFRRVGLCGLPGGYVFQDEDLDQAAKRILAERTGLTQIYLDQFGTFGKRNRTDGNFHEQLLSAMGEPLPDNHWITKRFVSIGYYALLDYSKANPTPDVFSESCGWFDIAQLPPLIFDHAEIVQKALDMLRIMLDYKLIGFNLLPKLFTMSELQGVYETILGRKLQRTNFQRKILSMNILVREQKKYGGGSHKAPYLYRFDTAYEAQVALEPVV
ncbi:MAG: NUDIX domain-containing protein [Siphonobacter sp.]